MLGNIGQIFKSRLKAELDARKWKVPDLARESGIPASTLYEIWNRDAWPQPDNLLKIATGLGVTVASLVSEGHLVTHNQALEIVSESVALAQKLGPALVARLTAMNETQIAALETALSERPISDDSTMSESNQEHEPKHDHGKRRNK